MTNAVKDVINLFWEPVLNVWDMFATYAPGIIAAFIFVLVGLFLARFLSTWLEQFLRRIKLDLYTSKVGINEILTRFGLGKSPSRVLSLYCTGLCFWYSLSLQQIFLIFLLYLRCLNSSWSDSFQR